MPRIIPNIGVSDFVKNNKYLNKLEVEKTALDALAPEHLRLQNELTAAQGSAFPLKKTMAEKVISVFEAGEADPAKKATIQQLLADIRGITDTALFKTRLSDFISTFGVANIPADIANALDALKEDSKGNSPLKQVADAIKISEDKLVSQLDGKNSIYSFFRKIAIWVCSLAPQASTTPAPTLIGRSFQRFYKLLNSGANYFASNTRTILKNEENAKETLEAFENGPFKVARENTSNAAVDAFIEAHGVRHKADFDQLRKAYDDTEALRKLWNIEPYVDQLDLAKKKERFGVRNVFGQTLKIHKRNRIALTLRSDSDPKNKKSITIHKGGFDTKGILSISEIMTLLERDDAKWKKEGIVIRTTNSVEAAQYAAAFEQLATLPGKEHYKKYIVQVGWGNYLTKGWSAFFGLSRQFYGAEHEVAKRYEKRRMEAPRLYLRRDHQNFDKAKRQGPAELAAYQAKLATRRPTVITPGAGAGAGPGSP